MFHCLTLPQQISEDEYIPIDHVLDANKKRIRLLNPYVIRLRRKLPFQTYKLRKVDVSFNFTTITNNKLMYYTHINEIN